MVTRTVTLYNSLWSNAPSFTNIGSAMDAKLQTATSSLDVYSIISVHKFDERMVPKFFWFDLRFAASLYSMYGVPVSICDSKIFSQSSRALMVLRPLFSDSYSKYNFSNASLWQSYSPGHSLGHISVHSAFSSTRFINKSGIHMA